MKRTNEQATLAATNSGRFVDIASLSHKQIDARITELQTFVGSGIDGVRGLVGNGVKLLSEQATSNFDQLYQQGRQHYDAQMSALLVVQQQNQLLGRTVIEQAEITRRESKTQHEVGLRAFVHQANLSSVTAASAPVAAPAAVTAAAPVAPPPVAVVPTARMTNGDDGAGVGIDFALADDTVTATDEAEIPRPEADVSDETGGESQPVVEPAQNVQEDRFLSPNLAAHTPDRSLPPTTPSPGPSADTVAVDGGAGPTAPAAVTLPATAEAEVRSPDASRDSTPAASTDISDDTGTGTGGKLQQTRVPNVQTPVQEPVQESDSPAPAAPMQTPGGKSTGASRKSAYFSAGSILTLSSSKLSPISPSNLTGLLA